MAVLFSAMLRTADKCLYVIHYENIREPVTMEEPSALEKVSGNLITEAGLTALAAYAATPLAALLPILSNSLANGRHTKRIEEALADVERTLQNHEAQIRNFSDAQFKIINEAILAILQTTQDSKIQYLKQAVQNNIGEEKVPITLAVQISRILRDISAEELAFLQGHFQYSRIVFDQDPVNDRELKVEANSEMGILVSGLISMGLIVPGSATWGDIGRYQFSPLVAKLLVVIRV